MTETEIEALRREMLAEFRTLNGRLAKMEASMLHGFSGVHDAIDGIAGKLLRPEEASAVRSTIRKADRPEVADR